MKLFFTPLFFIKNLLLSFVIGIVTFLIGTYLFKKVLPNSYSDFIAYQVYSFILTFFNIIYGYYIQIKRKEKNKISFFSLKQTFIHLSISTVLFFLMRFFTVYFTTDSDFYDFLLNESYSYYLFTFIIVFIVLFVITSIRNLKEEKKALINISRFEYRALKTQIEPHFLFNNFNTLVALIDENKEKAKEFVINMSEHYRYILSIRKEVLVSLKSELDFVNSYVNLIKMRFEGKVKLQINIPDDLLEKWLPPLSLQELLENALKHNTSTQKNPLLINIYSEKNESIIIENNMIPKPKKNKKSTGFGLEMLQSNYKYITKKNIVITKENNIFSVTLPLLSKQIKKSIL